MGVIECPAVNSDQILQEPTNYLMISSADVVKQTREKKSNQIKVKIYTFSHLHIHPAPCTQAHTQYAEKEKQTASMVTPGHTTMVTHTHTHTL